MKIITNTQNVKNFNTVGFEDANVVIVMNANTPTIGLIKVEDEENERDAVVEYLNDVTRGCNYRYEIIKKIGSTYFYN